VGRSPTRLPVADAFGERVRARRKQLKWSIEQLANECGLHWTYVGSVERGERNISLVNICRLAAALKIGANDLMVGLERKV
jgi:transcriptional regulator with XRE-family HTH domain